MKTPFWDEQNRFAVFESLTFHLFLARVRDAGFLTNRTVAPGQDYQFHTFKYTSDWWAIKPLTPAAELWLLTNL